MTAEPRPETGPRRDRRVTWLLALVLLAGLVLRLTHLLEAMTAPDFTAPQFESQYHDYWARALLSGDWTPPEGVTDPEIPTRPYFRPPGYPFFLAAVYAVLGPGYLGPRLAQTLLGLLSCVLVFALGRRVGGDGAGLGAAALVAFYWVLIFFEAELMEPALLVFLLLAALALAARWGAATGVGRAAVLGMLLGAAVLVRPNALVLVPALAVWLLWVKRRHGRAAGFVAPTAALVLGAALLIAPATLRNHRVAGEWVLVTSNAGINLFVGSHPEGDGFTPGVPELAELTGLSGWDSFDHPKIAAAIERREGRAMTDAEVSRFFTRRALANLRREPAASARLLLRKAALLLGPAEVSNNKILSVERARSPTLALGLGFPVALALCLAGLGFLARDLRRRPPALAVPEAQTVEASVLVLGYALVYGATFLPFFAAARFRVPVVPALAVFGGYALAWLWRALRGRRWRALVAGAALVAALRGLAGVSWVPYEDDPALWHYRRGLLWSERGELDRALEELVQAIELDPTNGDFQLAMAGALVRAGHPDVAMGRYRNAVALLPDSVPARNNLAMLLAARGELAEAIVHWRAALELDPERASVLVNLAYALATAPDPALRDRERARELAARAREVAGGDAGVLARVAEVERVLGD